MRILTQFSSLAFLLLALIFLLSTPNAYAAPFDCEKIKSLNKTESFEANPRDITQCQLRGFDPPTGWKIDDGKNSGIKAGGASGFSYGAISAPEASANARKKNASVRHNRMKAVCQFPPNVKFGWPPSFEFPKGSCYEVFNDLMKDKTGVVASAPPPPTIDASDRCPAETDSTGMYGIKTAITSSGTLSSSVSTCGGMIPSSFAELTLNSSPTHIAVTDNGSYSIRVFQRSGSDFVLVFEKALPTYLCTYRLSGDNEYWDKSYDLTPPVSQIISYSAGVDTIALRLQSRSSMDPNMTPPFDEFEPEKYLLLRVDAGNLIVPDQVSCPSETAHLGYASSTRQDIKIQPARDSDCDGISVDATAKNYPKIMCINGTPGYTADDTPADSAGKCYDASGAPAPSRSEDSWVAECPATREGTRSPPDPYTGKCPQSGGAYGSTVLCPDRTTAPSTAPSADGTCPGSGLKAEDVKAGHNLGSFSIEPPACGTTAMNCDVTTLGVTSGADSCKTKLQYAVLNRPNLYFPPSKSVVLNKIQTVSTPSGALVNYGFMAETVDNSQYFTLGQTEIFLQASAPAVKFGEGGYVKLRDRSTLIMNPTATVTAGSGTIVLNGGGQLVSPGGLQLQAFADGATYTIPSGLLELPMQVRVNRSITLPAGFMIPTMPVVTGKPAYFRQPIDSAPM